MASSSIFQSSDIGMNTSMFSLSYPHRPGRSQSTELLSQLDHMKYRRIKQLIFGNLFY
jgi:hypothetical protein